MNNPTIYIFGNVLFQSLLLPLRQEPANKDKKPSPIQQTVQKLWDQQSVFKSVKTTPADIYDFAAEGKKTIKATTFIVEGYQHFEIAGQVFRVKISLKDSTQKTDNLVSGSQLDPLPDVERLAYEIDTTVEKCRTKTNWIKLGDLKAPSRKLKTVLADEDIKKCLQHINTSAIELNQKLFESVQTIVMQNIDYLKNKTKKSDLQGTWQCSSSGLLQDKICDKSRAIGPYNSMNVIANNTDYLMSFALPDRTSLSCAETVFFIRVLKITMEKKADLLAKNVVYTDRVSS